LFRGSLNDKYLCCLFNKSVNYSLIRKDVAECLEPLQRLGKKMKVTSADTNNLFAEYATRSNFCVSNDVELSNEFFVVNDLSEEAVIGALTMQKWKMKLDFEHERVEVDPRMAKMQVIQLK